jgi:hypothetical protein
MKKEYVITGLAILGAVALFTWYSSKPKKNSDGFFSATGGCGCGCGA